MFEYVYGCELTIPMDIYVCVCVCMCVMRVCVAVCILCKDH